MHLRLARRVTAIGMVAGLGLSALAAPAEAESTDPVTPLLTQLLSPTLVDPVIGLLAALPAKHRPYTGPVCASGDPQCIVEVIEEMKARLAPLAASCSHDAIFSLAYLRVTENVKAAADSGYFADRTWLTQVDAVFAQMYFDTLDAWNAGEFRAVPHAWRLALQATRDRTLSGLGDFMMNMNAHINNDFPRVLAQVGLVDASGRSHKPDHDAYNQRLDALYHPVFAEEAARFDPTFDKLDVGPVDEVLVGLIMRGWREMVWRHAEALVNAPAILRPLVEKEIEEYAATQAQLIRLVFAAAPAKRDAWCATHHG